MKTSLRQYFRYLMPSLLLFLFTFSCAHVNRAPENTESGEPEFSTFAVSTEMEIGKAWPIIEKASAGAYVSVGAERSFRGFSMSPNATELYILDISPRVIRFATINRELLHARDMAAYRHLRFDSDFNAWQQLQSKQRVQHVLSAEDFSWWEKEVRDLFSKHRYTLPEMLNRHGSDVNYQDYLRFYQGFRRLFKELTPKAHKKIAKLILREKIEKVERLVNKASLNLEFSLDEVKAFRERAKNCCINALVKHPGLALDIATIINFEHGNYLFDEKLYHRLHRAAINKQIDIQQVNLAVDNELVAFVDQLKLRKVSVGVLDLDNTYLQNYIGDPGFGKIVTKFGDVAKDDSILLGMSNVLDLLCTQFQSYFGFRYSLLKTMPKDFPFARYFHSLPQQVMIHMDQKLYDVFHKPPYFLTWQDLPPSL